jgi:hypothetical protein
MKVSISTHLLSKAIEAIIELQQDRKDYLNTGTAFEPREVRKQIRELRKLETGLAKALNSKEAQL